MSSRLRTVAARIQLAVRRPDLMLRHLRGGRAIDIDLDEIAPFVGPRPVIVEAGALDGSDTAAFAARWPDAEIYAFEPVPAAFEVVEERTRHLPGVRRFQLALGARSATSTMYVSADESGHHRPDSSSLLAPSGHLVEFPTVTFGETVEVETTTLTEWAAREGVTTIDLLWLDLQGMELAVLEASQDVLAATSAVVLETSRRPLYVGSPVYPEVVAWMTARGFRVALDRVGVIYGNILFVKDPPPS